MKNAAAYARLQSSALASALADDAVWYRAGEAVNVTGFYDPVADSDLDARARPVRAEFSGRASDFAGIVVGDRLTVAGVEHDIVQGIRIDETRDEILLPLRPRRKTA